MLLVQTGLSLIAPRIAKRLVFGRFARPIETVQSVVRKDDISMELRRSPSYSKSSQRLSLRLGTSFHSCVPSSPWFSYRVKHTRSTGHVTRKRVGHKILVMTGRNSSSRTQGCTLRRYPRRGLRKIWQRPRLIFTNASLTFRSLVFERSCNYQIITYKFCEWYSQNLCVIIIWFALRRRTI